MSTSQPLQPPPSAKGGTHNQGGTPAISTLALGSYGKGVLCCLIATVSFGLMFPVMSDALRHIDPFTFTSLRYLLAAAACVILLRVKEGRGAFALKGEPLGLAWLLGSIGFAGFGFLVFLGQQMAGRDGALTASIMAATQPMMGVVVNAVVRRTAPPRYTFLFVLLSFFGVALVITKGEVSGLWNGPGNYWANGLIILGMLFWIIYTFSAGYFTRWSVLRYTTMTMVLGWTSSALLNGVLFASHTIPMPNLSDVIAIIPHLLYMSFIVSFGGVLLWNFGTRIISPLNSVVFMDVVPITAFAVSSLTGVIPTQFQIVGACITGAALIMNNLYLRFHAQRSRAVK